VEGGETAVADHPVMRLVRFRPVYPEFDGRFRAAMLPELRDLPGLIDLHLGRRGPETLGDRFAVSVWADRDSMVAGVGASLDDAIFHPEWQSEAEDRVLEVYPLDIALRFDRGTPPVVLRVLRGAVAAGELSSYVEVARGGLLADAQADRRPNAIYLASIPPDRFVTVSLWPTWSAIEVATGGNVDRPILAAGPRLVVDTDVVHYEVITGAP